MRPQSIKNIWWVWPLNALLKLAIKIAGSLCVIIFYNVNGLQHIVYLLNKFKALIQNYPIHLLLASYSSFYIIARWLAKCS